MSLFTSGSQFLLDGLVGAQPSAPTSTHGRTWFDGATAGDWPLEVPMGLDASGSPNPNASTMIRVFKGTAVGSYTPFYWAVGGYGYGTASSNYAPAATFEVYDATPPTNLTAMGCSSTTGGCLLTATLSGPYTGSAALNYCIQINGVGTLTRTTGARTVVRRTCPAQYRSRAALPKASITTSA